MIDLNNPELQSLAEAAFYDESTRPIFLDWLEEYKAGLREIYYLYLGPTQTSPGCGERAVIDYLDRTGKKIAGLENRIPVVVSTRTGYEVYCPGASTNYPVITLQGVSYATTHLPRKQLFLLHPFWAEHFSLEVEKTITRDQLKLMVGMYSKQSLNVEYYTDKILVGFDPTRGIKTTQNYRQISMKQELTPADQLGWNRCMKKHTSYFACRKVLKAFIIEVCQ